MMFILDIRSYGLIDLPQEPSPEPEPEFHKESSARMVNTLHSGRGQQTSQ